MRRLGIVLGCAGLGLAVLAPSAGAATIVPDVFDDTPPGIDFDCTLRDAIQSANLNTDVSNCDATGSYGTAPDTIVLEGGMTYTLEQNDPTGPVGDGGDNDNVFGDLDVEGPLTVTTSGAGLATVDALDTAVFAGTDFTVLDRVFHIELNAGGVTLNRLRITGGLVANAGGGFPTLGGGGILTESALTVTNSEIVGNIAQQYNINFSQMGGGIMVRGQQARLTMSGSTVANNIVRTDPDFTGGGGVIGGGIAAFPLDVGFPVPLGVNISNSTISGNQAVGTAANQSGSVGGIFTSSATLQGVPVQSTPTTLTNVTVTNNLATSPTAGNGAVGGTQIALGTITGSLIASNTDTRPNNFDNPNVGGPDGDFPDCGLTPTSGGGNVIGETAVGGCATFASPNDLIGTTSPGGSIPADVGPLVPISPGLTRAHAPNSTSFAVNRGGTCLATDQTGLFRYIAAPCDAGSIELGATATPPPVAQQQQPIVSTPAPTAAKCPKGKKAKRVKGKLKCVKKKRKK